MSIPIAFAFRFVPVMCLEDCYFVDGNFARTVAPPQAGDDKFDRLDFEIIYHDSPLSADQMQRYQNGRMSEVVVAQGLSLQFIDRIICRTVHEERTLRYRLHLEGIDPPPIIVEQRGSVFMRRGMVIQEVYVKDRMLHFRFNAPAVGLQDDYEITVTCVTENQTRNFRLRPGAYRVPQILVTDPNAVWRILIEGCLAFESIIPRDRTVVS